MAASTAIDRNQVITFAVQVKENPNIQRKLNELYELPINQRVFLDDADFDPGTGDRDNDPNYYGALKADIDKIRDWVDHVNAGVTDPTLRLTISSVEHDIHAVKIATTAGRAADLLKVELINWKQDESTLMGKQHQDAQIPAELVGTVRGIIGFNTLGAFSPQYVPLEQTPLESALLQGAAVLPFLRNVHTFVKDAKTNHSIFHAGRASQGHPMFPDELATFMNVPNLAGKQKRVPRVAILEYGGGTSQENIYAVAALRKVDPSLIHPIDRYYVGGIDPNNDPESNGECNMDGQAITIGLASAGIENQLVEINALDTEMGAGDAVAWAARSKGHPLGGAGADMGSESWSDPKCNWTDACIAYRRAAIRFAMLKGVPIFVATGDNSSRSTTPNITVEYFSGDPDHVAVSGTRIWTDAFGVKHEITWSGPRPLEGTGGGVDTDVPVPYYQANVGLKPVSAANGQTGRGIGDISADAAPETGCIVLTEDAAGKTMKYQPIGGTSLAAPLCAMVEAARLAADGYRMGPAHGIYYALWLREQSLPPEQRVFRPITVGNNGDYTAADGLPPNGLGGFNDASLFAQRAATIQPVPLNRSLVDSIPQQEVA